VVKLVNQLRRKEAEAPSAPPAPTRTESLLEDILGAIRSSKP
jgi:large conductance mechanosensitive channel